MSAGPVCGVLNVRRRDFLGLIGGATTFRSLAGAAQLQTRPLIGFLSVRSPGPAGGQTKRYYGLKRGAGAEANRDAVTAGTLGPESSAAHTPLQSGCSSVPA